MCWSVFWVWRKLKNLHKNPYKQARNNKKLGSHMPARHTTQLFKKRWKSNPRPDERLAASSWQIFKFEAHAQNEKRRRCEQDRYVLAQPFTEKFALFRGRVRGLMWCWYRKRSYPSRNHYLTVAEDDHWVAFPLQGSRQSSIMLICPNHRSLHCLSKQNLPCIPVFSYTDSTITWSQHEMWRIRRNHGPHVNHV